MKIKIQNNSPKADLATFLAGIAITALFALDYQYLIKLL
jgi:hypothetical protein